MMLKHIFLYFVYHFHYILMDIPSLQNSLSNMNLEMVKFISSNFETVSWPFRPNPFAILGRKH